MGNYVYSNAVGINTLAGFYGAVNSNLVYANSNRGLSIQGANGSQFYNNMIYQAVGDGIRIDSSAQNLRLSNNIIWVLAGYGLYVDGNSQASLSSDYNLFYRGTAGVAFVGNWNGTNQSTIGDWRSSSGKDANSLEADPGFVDIDGADNTLGYDIVRNIDGGKDDNFYRTKNSPAIDRGSSWSTAAADIEGFPRVDDPATFNAGGSDYNTTSSQSSLFGPAAIGVAQNWRADDSYWAQTIPFNHPLYGVNYTSVNVSSNGFLQFASTSPYPGDAHNSTVSLSSGIRIAPLWDDLRTDRTGDDIFVDTSVVNQITIRWAATVYTTGTKANFAATLFSDGSIRFDYGNGNTDLTPTVGISRGDGRFFTLVSGYDGAPSLTNADSVTFNLVPGIVDIGAYEFRGDSSDSISPAVVATSPTAAVTATRPTDVRLTFSEELNPIDARSPAAYELRDAGPDNAFDTADDVIYKLDPHYTPGQNTVILGLEDSILSLSLGNYRVTALGTASTSLYDLAGNRFDGDANGTPGGNYVRTFKVIDNTVPVLLGANSLADIDENVPDASNLGSLVSAIINNNVTDPDGPASGIAITEAASLNGTWQYSLDGTTYQPVLPKLTGGKVLLLAADSDSRVRFVPNANYSGVVNDLIFSAWDQADELIEGTDILPSMLTANSLSDEHAAASINIIHVNSAPTDVTLSGNGVAENLPAGSIVGSLTAIDPDASDTHTFTLVPGTGDDDNQLFEIVGTQLSTKQAFDFETKPSYTIRVRATDSAGNGYEKTLSVLVLNAPELVGNIVVGDGTAQRSVVKELDLTFDSEISVDAGAFQVDRRTYDAQNNLVLVSIPTNVELIPLADGKMQVRLTFYAIGAPNVPIRLMDGNYQLRINGALIESTSSNVRFDGDHDGVGGGDQMFGTEEIDHFYAFFGDIRGLRVVGNVEYNAFRQAYGKAVGQPGFNAAMDTDLNGAIGTVDYNESRKSQQKRGLTWDL